MAIKKANEKQIQLLQSLLRKSKYDLIGKRFEDLSSVECSVIIDFLNNDCQIKTTNWKDEPIDEYYLRKNKILIDELLKYNEDKVIGAPSPRALEFFKKLANDNKYEITVNDDELTAKIVYDLTNHLLNKEKNQLLAEQYLRDKMNNSDDNMTIEYINMIEIPEIQ